MSRHLDPSLSALERRAHRRVGLKLGWAMHAFVYLCVNLGLFAIAQTTPNPRWHTFPLMGWGLGLAIHGLVVFWRLSNEGWRERLVARELRRLQEPNR